MQTSSGASPMVLFSGCQGLFPRG